MIKEFNAVCGQLVLTTLERRTGYLLTSDAGGTALIIDQWIDLVKLANAILEEDRQLQSRMDPRNEKQDDKKDPK